MKIKISFVADVERVRERVAAEIVVEFIGARVEVVRGKDAVLVHGVEQRRRALPGQPVARDRVAAQMLDPFFQEIRGLVLVVHRGDGGAGSGHAKPCQEAPRHQESAPNPDLQSTELYTEVSREAAMGNSGDRSTRDPSGF